MTRILAVLTLFALAACSESEKSGPLGTHALFDLKAALAEPANFYDFPYPSDLRLTVDGQPGLATFPNPKKIKVVENLREGAAARNGFPAVPVAYFRFSADVAAQKIETAIAAEASSPILLIDIDEKSPTRGKLFPLVALTLTPDDFTPEHVLAAAARPGFILNGRRTYAFVVKRSLRDAEGKLLDAPPFMTSILEGEASKAARDLYAPLWPALRTLKISPSDIAAATVFTTADVVQDMYDLSTSILEKYSVSITGLHMDSADGNHGRFCELVGTVSYPQFQTGEPPFETGGVFEIGSDGLPKKQRDEIAPITITLPKTGAMPAEGYPLMVYFHGSGGISGAVVDRGRWTEALQANTLGEGPSFVLAPYGIAAAASALPVNPERLLNADETAYLNINNVKAFPNTFRQGAIEQRLFIKALKDLRIAPTTAAGCTGLALPAGATEYKFNPDALVAQGQSMGGMYTNMIGSIEPRIRAVVPTGAGGYWSYFILETSLIPNADKLLGIMLGTKVPLTFMHPAMHLLETTFEPADPIVYMPRLAYRPLKDHPVRPIYEPAGKDDSYFPTTVYDTVALAYNHPQTGDEVWPSMQKALALAGLDGILPYPVANNLKSEDGRKYTGAVIQYEGDGIYDPHALYTQLDSVKYQYGCFLDTFLKTGTAVILAPKALDSPCN